MSKSRTVSPAEIWRDQYICRKTKTKFGRALHMLAVVRFFDNTLAEGWRKALFAGGDAERGEVHDEMLVWLNDNLSTHAMRLDYDEKRHDLMVVTNKPDSGELE